MKLQLRGAWVLVLVLLLGSAGNAQTNTELLQKGIYTQETLGDLDGAIRIYQQVIAAAPVASDVRVQAQRRLEGAETLRRLAALRPPPAAAAGRLLGVVAAGHYKHTWTGVTFPVPDGWRVHPTGMSSDGGEMVTLSPSDPQAYVAVWMKEDANAPDVARQMLLGAPTEKVKQREGFEAYQMREASLQLVNLGRHEAMLAIADYKESGKPMVEYMTWIYTERTRAFFFARLEADKLDLLRPQFDAMVAAAVVP